MTVAGRVRPSGQDDGRGTSIGAVLAQLRPDFPDVTISKIRFLESEGLIRPARTESGYRQFRPADVRRLRYVLAAQRDRYLPLKVIRQQLAEADRAEEARHPEAAAVDRSALLAESGIEPDTLAELEEYGLIRPGPAGTYDPDSVELAVTVRALADFGLGPAHLRAFRAAADHQIGLLEPLVAPLYAGGDRTADPAGRQRADAAAGELAGLSATLHALLVKAGLRAARG